MMEDYKYVNENITSENDISSFEMSAQEDGSYIVTIVRADGAKSVSVGNESIVETTLYDKDGSIVDNEVIDITDVDENYDDKSDLSNISRNNVIKWKMKIMEFYKKDYWYRKGQSDKTEYIRIGCQSKYLEFDKSTLSPEQVAKCDEFVSKVKVCNVKFGFAKGLCVLAGIPIGVCIAAVSGATVLGISIGTVFELANSINEMVSDKSMATKLFEALVFSQKTYKEIETLYTEISAYGELKNETV